MLRGGRHCLSSFFSGSGRRHQSHGLHYPKLYQNTHELQQRDNRKVLEFYQSALSREIAKSEGSQVLDIGCGSGDTTHKTLRPLMVDDFGCRRIVATDISTSMLDYARGAYPHRAISYDVFDVSSADSAQELVSRYGHFEFVFSFYTLHWVRDLAGALANVRRVMLPQGQPSECLLSFLALNPALLVYRILGKDSRWAKYVESTTIPFGEIYTQESLQQMAESCDLKLRSCEVLSMEFGHASLEKLRDSAVAVCPIHRTIPAEQRNDFEKDLVKSYLEISGGSEIFNYQIAVLHARSD
ncbi:juvenile hormone acid O-methyltransferase [Galendromus occidentalis]|uniref:Juvenile hormone acid O-methyltransferase n=1 Tax=Galendromus occidentalis TaxID=34638 RepID=A0AAJ7P9P2_9ACAR|nr:juvenile hormone acid O-methyltransferase [Galendromus occidentalis]